MREKQPLAFAEEMDLMISGNVSASYGEDSGLVPGPAERAPDLPLVTVKSFPAPAFQASSSFSAVPLGLSCLVR